MARSPLLDRLAADSAVNLSLAFRQVRVLKGAGWRVRVWKQDNERAVLRVDGTDNHGDRFRGEIDRHGNLRGEPVDD